jgi:HAMP domain-containing protein
MGRSVAAVIGGSAVMVAGVMLANFALVLLVPGALSPAGPEASGSMRVLVLLLAANLLAAAAGGYVCARVAKTSELRHALALGMVQAILYAMSALMEREVGVPLWFHVGMVALLIPAAMLGGWMRAGQRRRILEPAV